MRLLERREVRVRCWALLVAAALGAQALLGTGKGLAAGSAEARKLPPGEAAAWLMLGGLRALALGATWVRMLDAYRGGDYEEVPALAAVITALDPELEEAWIVSAWTLAVEIPDRLPTLDAWPWIRQGLLQLRRGEQRNPDAWRLLYNEGWIVLLHVAPKPACARRLEADHELNPEGFDALGYAQARFERAAKLTHPVALDWARLDVLLARASGAKGEQRVRILARARRVIEHVRREHPRTAPAAISDWERLIERLERVGSERG